MKTILWLLSYAAGLAVAAWILDGISVEGADWQEKLPPLLLVAAILGLISLVVKPVVKLLSLPVIILTLGLFLLVINALMLMLTDWFADKVDIGFHVDGFWTALFGGIVISLVTSFINATLIEDD